MAFKTDESVMFCRGVEGFHCTCSNVNSALYMYNV